MTTGDFFSCLTNLNVSFFIGEARKAEYCDGGPFSKKLLEKINFAALLNSAVPESSVRSMIDPAGYHFIQAKKLETLYFIGPFIMENEKSIRIAGQFSLRNRMPVLKEAQLEAYLSAISLHVLHGDDEVLLPPIETTPIQIMLEQEDDLDISEIELKYRLEREFRDIISRGDREALQKRMSLFNIQNDFSYRVPGNPLRAQKNIAIVGNTIGRHAAEKGGLPPHMLHMLSEEYAIKIERSRSLEELSKLNIRILTGYCDAVHNYGIKSHSAAVRKASNYILQHLSDKMELSRLAKEAGCSPNHLSAIFRKETGQTVSSYIRSKRMTEARWMIYHSDESITNIALQIGYDDPNYFSRCFSRETGMSPAEYRKSRADDDFNGLP